MISVEAELVWTAELHRRQEEHVDEVRRRLHALPEGQRVHLRYGPDSQVEGIIEEIDSSLVRLRLSENWTRWVPLLQVDAIDGIDVETAKRLERPRGAGVVNRVVAGTIGGSRCSG